MIKPIVLYGNSILREKCLPFSKGTDLREIIQDLWDTMYNSKGIGLALPQIGSSQRLFVIDIPNVIKKVFINPTILEKTGEYMIMNEGCLSIPELEGPVIRKDHIVIEYYNEDWIYLKEEYSGIKSRVIQHEYDHLEGKLWVDRLAKVSAEEMLNILTVLHQCKSKNRTQ